MLSACDVAAVLRGHVALLLAHGAILPMQRASLALGDLAFLALLLDALVLVGEAVIDLCGSGMVLRPSPDLSRGSSASGPLTG